MVAGEVEAAVKRYLVCLADEGIAVVKAVVFGSQAMGTASESSDIDLLVISRFFDTHRDHRAAELLWLVKSRVDHRIEPIPCGLDEWLNGTERLIVEIARRDGISIQPEAA
jgi:predicted nucleotidyltransferase